MIELRDVGHEWAARTPWAHRALTGVSLTIGHGERVVVVGANGSGKSTLAWVLGGVLTPSEGVALVDGAPLPGSPRVALAFQHARLQVLRPTVGADVRLAATSPAAAERAMRLVGLDPVADGRRPTDQLSGGQLRRVVLAALLAREPELLVLDEPLAGLDRAGRTQLVEVLGHLDCATVVVTHDLDLVPVLGERVVTLERGRVVADEPVGVR